MKRILMVVEALGGGVFTYVSQLSNDMCDYFEIYVAYAIRSQTPENFKDFFDPRVKLIEIEKFSNLKNPLNVVKVIMELEKIEKEINPASIHLHSSIAGGFGRIAFCGKNKNLIYTPHGYSYIMCGEKTLKGRVYKFIEKILGKTNCITLTCCHSEKEEAKKFSKKTTFIETGINLEELDTALNNCTPPTKNKFTVFTLGRICPQKQPQLFNKIAELVPEASFLWIGSGELEKELRAPNIEVTGWMTRNEALSLAKGADVFILCSRGEAIAMSLIENMYIKKLCLVSNVIGNKSVIKNGVNGYICEEAEDYAKQIKQSMKQFPSILLEKAYQDVISIYNSKVMREKYIQFYSGLK